MKEITTPEVVTFVSGLLNLSDTQVLSIRESTDGRAITIEVKSTCEHVHCRQCGGPTRGHGLGRPLRLRHLSILGKETYIEITPRRGICEYCDDSTTTTETLEWYNTNSKMTKPYEQHLLFELVNSTVADVSRKEQVDYQAVHNLIDRYIESEIDWSKISALGILGIDEISMKKGYQDYVTLITYRINDKVHILGVIPGREKAAIKAFLNKIPKRLRKTIAAVCCDLYDGYMNACKEVFKKRIPIVADRFHVRKLYRKSLINLRKSELVRLKKELTDAEYTSLKLAIRLLRRQKDYFTDDEKEIVKPLFELSPKLKQAYQFSRELTGIFDSQITPTVAKERMTMWMGAVNESELNCFYKFIKTLTLYQEEITNYFINRNNSGFVEGFNNKVKVLKRRCYGLSSAAKLFQRLIIDTLGLERFAPSVAAL